MIFSGPAAILLFFLVFSLGACIGSFLNVVILRLPLRDESIIFPASHCPVCKKTIHWFDNIPLLSYFLFLRGRCRACGTHISMQYPLVELCMGLLSLALLKKFGLSYEFVFYFVFAAALLAVIFIDLQHQIIPDVISLPGIVIGFVGAFFNSTLSWQQSGLGILLGGGILYAIAFGYFLLTKREGMGGGDIKLLGMIGAFLGWQSLLFVLFASSVIGSIVGIGAMINQKKGGKTRIPYGPFLSIAALFFLFFQERIFIVWQNYLTGGLF